MPEVKELHVKCLICRKWFRPPIFFNGLDNNDLSILEGKKAWCPCCEQLTDCNEENMRIREKDSGFEDSDHQV